MIQKIIIFYLSVQFSVAQSLNLEQLTKLGLDKNQDLSLALKRIDLQKSLINTALEMPKTKVDLQVGNIQTPFVTDYTLGIVQNTELPKVYKLRKTLNESLVKIGEGDLEILKNDYRFGVSNIYFQLFYNQEVIAFLRNENLKLQDIEKVYRRRQEEGETDGVEATNVNLRISENEMKISNLQNQQYELEGKLKYALNVPTLPTISFLDALPNLGSSIDGNAKIKTQSYQIESSSLSLQNDKYKLLPSFNVGFMNQSMLGSWRQFIGVVGVEIPVFNKAQKSLVEASRINTEIQQMELERIKNQLQNEVIAQEKVLLEIEKNRALIKDRLLVDSDRVMQVTMKKYLAGQVDYFDWYLTYNQNLMYKLELLSLQKNKNLTISNIKYLTGNE
jgi:outer membrane protein TolC